MDFLDNIFPEVPQVATGRAVGTHKRPRPTDDWWNEVSELPDWEFSPPKLDTPEDLASYAQASHRAMYHERLNRTKRPRSGQTPEAALTKEGNNWLASVGVFLIRINAGTFKVVDPDGDTRYIAGPPLGTHDWVGCLPTGRFITIEYKGTREATDKQKAFQSKVQALGGLSLIVYDVDRDLKPPVMAELQDWQLDGGVTT